MKLPIIILLLLILGLPARATNLRGQVLRYNPASKSYYPLAGVRVDLWIYNGQQWIDLAFAQTGQDGTYLFVNISPGYIFHVQVLGNSFPAQPLTVLNIYPPNYQPIPTITI
jgi:hypothetical protein